MGLGDGRGIGLDGGGPAIGGRGFTGGRSTGGLAIGCSGFGLTTGGGR